MKKIENIEDINNILNMKESNDTLEENRQTGCKGFTITDEIMQIDNLKTKVLKYVLYKKRTEQEIRKKFEEEPAEYLDQVIETLRGLKYIDDENYINRAISEYIALKDLSIKELSYKLIVKGIRKEELESYINNHIEELEEYELKSAINIIKKKLKNEEVVKIKNKLYSKGYKSHIVNQAIEELEIN